MPHTADPLAAYEAEALIADLVHDTALNVEPVGVRSGTGRDSRRLPFAIDEVELLVQVSARGPDAAVGVAGQVAVADIPLVGIPVRLEFDGACHTTTTERGGRNPDAGLTCGTSHLTRVSRSVPYPPRVAPGPMRGRAG
jgi:hypothetical protein